MNNLIRVVILIVFLNTIGYAGNSVDSWFSDDKAYHLLGSMMSTIMISKTTNVHFDYQYKKSKYAGVGITFSLGIFKELMDRKKPGNIFSWKDLAADVTGISCALIILDVQ